MVRYKAVVAYDGTNYSGFQRQENGNTVQAELEKTLTKFNNGEPIIIHGSGRTDAGVHAYGQVIHFDYPQERDPEKLRHALDTQTPADIAVPSVERAADDFHARYDAIEKTYHYHLNTSKIRNPFKRHYAAFFPYELNLEEMQKAIAKFEGTHDFSTFCATGTVIENRIRTIHEATITQLNADELLFTFRGDGFLYKMVRILVGTLIRVGNGRIPVSEIERIIASQDRQLAGPTAHPEGLYLMEVKYPTK